MQRIILVFLLVFIVILVVFFIFKTPDKITNFPAKNDTVVAFGDSLVEGVGSTEGNDFVSVLSREIGKPIFNLGVSGNTTIDGLTRIKEVEEFKPGIVILLLGGNDFLRKIPIEETFQNLERIITRLQESGTLVIILGVRGGILSDHFDERFKELAKNKGALYVPNVLDGLLTHPDLMSDSIHPNNLGYEKIAKKILPQLEKALGK